MTAKIIRSTLAAGCILAASLQAAAAEEFIAVDGAAEQIQSRRYEVADPKTLLRASLAILQDIRFQVTKSEVEPGLLVADAPRHTCWCKRSVTISLHPVQGREDNYQVRITSSGTGGQGLFGEKPMPAQTDFYQDFFAQLEQELFKERQQ